MEKLKWHTEKRKIDDLVPYEQNPRQMTDKQVEDLKGSLEKFDLVEIPAIDTDNKIIAGHQRLKILQVLGRGSEEIDVRAPNRKLTDEEFREYNIRSNKNLGEWDFDALANNFEIDDLLDWGFDEKELKIDLEVEEDEVPEVPKEAVSKLGEIYQLGNHRLMCGDSTKKEDVEKLMNGKKADMVFTDPPYGNLNIENVRTSNVAKAGKYKMYKGHANFDFKPCWDLIKDWQCKKVIWGGNYFTNFLPITNSWIIWDKRAGEHSYFSDAEMAWSNLGIPIKLFSIIWAGMIREGESDKRVHPTQKPINLSMNILKEYAKNEINIIDLFGGSGSTLIACEQLDRKCYMMELDPKYTDVIIKRWEKFTGEKAVKL